MSRLLIDAGHRLREHPPAPRPTVAELRQRVTRRSRRRSGVAAVAVVAVGIGGMAAVAARGQDRAEPAVPGISVSPVVSVPAALGWPPRLLLEGDWTITHFNQNRASSDGDVGGVLTFMSTAAPVVASADVETSTTSTDPQGAQPPPTVPAQGVTPAAPQVDVMWSTTDRTQAWSTIPTSSPNQTVGWEPLTVLDHPAQTLQINDMTYVVVVAVPEGSIELRVPATNRAELNRIVDGLRVVDAAEFDAALPATVVTPSQRAAVVEEMLEGVPTPPGFDIGPVATDPIYSDRVTLATTVAAEVACGWLDEWFNVWETEDAAELDAILTALEASPGWPMLTDITPQQSGFPDALAQIVDSLRDGGSVMTGAGPAPITRDNAASSLGCPR